MNEHTLKFFGEELAQLKAEVARLGGLAEAQVADSVEAVAKRDVALAQAVVGRDERLDALQREIEKKSIRLIALRQPVAQDLRRTVGALKMSWSLERTGDMAKNIAKRALIIADSEPIIPLTRSIERMGRLVTSRLKEALDAYTAGDTQRAMGVWTSDDEVDEHYNSLFRELLTYMMSDPRTIGACAHLLFIGKNLERIGDHATNIAEIIHYEATGEEILGERPKWSSADMPSPPAED
ncbi:MAG TPA: phosphate signaling complex protein PhoU [Caulobacteraceae bacterium]|jgi:phosphate transport system protein|nr:phosphate signaling complex protein PhoU [Caulobacteraceae bacterium]